MVEFVFLYESVFFLFGFVEYDGGVDESDEPGGYCYF